MADRLPHEQSSSNVRRRASTGSISTTSPFRSQRVRVLVEPRLFRIPGFRRYHGYSFWRTIVVRDENASSDLLTHELCHVWQAQRRPLAQIWAWVRYSYRSNPFERDARAAVSATRPNDSIAPEVSMV